MTVEGTESINKGVISSSLVLLHGKGVADEERFMARWKEYW